MTNVTQSPQGDVMPSQAETQETHEMQEMRASHDALASRVQMLKQFLVLSGIVVALQSAIMITVLMQSTR